ncbi:hypothetical protein K8I61_09545 [bacterium]|nr:hypothetical protein [bacterium]
MIRSVVIAVLFTFCVTASAAAGVAQWKTIKTTHFRFEYTDPDERMARYLADHAETIRAEVTYLIGFDFNARTRVVIAPSLEAYTTTQPRSIVPEWSIGAAFPRDNLIVLLSPRAAIRESSNVEPLETFKHEVVHIVMGRALAPRDAPRWLDEGIAKHVTEPWHEGKTLRMTYAVLAGKTIPLSRLTRGFPRDEDEAHLAYLQSQAWVDYLFRRAAIADVVEKLREGQSIEQALSYATHVPVHDLDREFHEFIEANYTWVHVLIGGDLVWGAASMLFLVVIVVYFFRSRRRMRRLQLEDDLDELRGQRRDLLRERKKRRLYKRWEDFADDYLDYDN